MAEKIITDGQRAEVNEFVRQLKEEVAPFVREVAADIQPALKDVAQPVFETMFEVLYNHKGFDRLVSLGASIRFVEAMIESGANVTDASSRERMSQYAWDLATKLIQQSK